MSLNPDVDGVVASRPHSEEAAAHGSAPAPVDSITVAQPEAGYPAPLWTPIAQPGPSQPAAALEPALPEFQRAWVAPEATIPADHARGRRGWVVAVAAGSVGLIAAGTLGYFLYSTTGQRDAALQEVASTQATLTATQQDLAARNVTAAYASMYIADSGRVTIDYQNLTACTSFGSCRTAAQSLLTNLQSFQSDRSTAAVPAALANSDGMLRDGLSAAIAAVQELISGMDNGNVKKFKDGWHKLEAAMLSIAKAEAALGAELK